MNHQLISDLARAEIDERIRSGERERLARLAGAYRSRSRASRVTAATDWLRSSLSTWRLRNQLGALSVPLSSEGCVDPAAQ